MPQTSLLPTLSYHSFPIPLLFLPFLPFLAFLPCLPLLPFIPFLPFLPFLPNALPFVIIPYKCIGLVRLSCPPVAVHLSASSSSLTTTIAGHVGLYGGGGSLPQSINSTAPTINPTASTSTSTSASAASVFPSSYVNASLPLNDSANLNDTMMTVSRVKTFYFLIFC